MLSQTRRGLEDFDNQHDFERMAADILNGLGYSSVEPMAPKGGADGGQDIQFKEGDALGIAFATLDKKIRNKFKFDLGKQENGEGVIALFCNVDVSPSMKREFASDAISKGYRLEVFDLERLRSLLDSSLKAIRRRYLKIDDEVTARLRSEVKKLLEFPAAIPDTATPQTIIETIFADRLPRRLFDLLMRYEEKDIVEVPGIGNALQHHLKTYYGFREQAEKFEDDLMFKIGQMVGVRFTAGWKIYLRYAMLRFGGATKEQIISWGDFLNYGITWENAEKTFLDLSSTAEVTSKASELFEIHRRLSHGLNDLKNY